VIQSGAASVRLLQDSAAVSTEIAGTEGDVHGLLGDSFFHTVHRVFNLLIEVNMALDFVEVMSALFEFLCLITVVLFFHCTVVFQELEMVFHPAAAAAPATVVLVVVGSIEVPFVILTTSTIGQCAVNTLLLGDAPGVLSRLDGQGALKSRGDSKSPAGTAAALVFDFEHFNLVLRVFSGSPVDSLRNIRESSAAWTVHGQANFFFVGHFGRKTHIFFFQSFWRHGGGKVMFIDESIGVIGARHCIYGINPFVCIVIALLLLKEIACYTDVQVESGGVRQEGLVVHELGVKTTSSASVSA